MTDSPTNPLLSDDLLPDFEQIQPEHAEPAIDAVLAECREAIERVADTSQEASWDNVAWPLLVCNDRLDRVWSPVSHLHAVMNSDGWRKAHERCLPKLSAYYSDLSQDERIYRRFVLLMESPRYSDLDHAQQTIVRHNVRDFRRAGVHLDADKKARLKAISERLSELSTRFSQNLLDATDAWTMHITDKAELAGMPASALALAEQEAKARDLDGWVFTLQMPSAFPFLAHCRSAERRQELHRALQSRASELGDGTRDNGPLIVEILQLRQEKANLLGFDDYAAYQLADRMAGTPRRVLDFLDDLSQRSYALAQQEMAGIDAYAREHGADTVGPADVGFWAERQKEERYAFNQEELRPYFPADRVLKGMFDIAERLFGITVEACDAPLWHESAGIYR
ncbi:unnamed protein product, partial [Cyprideis torosa]